MMKILGFLNIRFIQSKLISQQNKQMGALIICFRQVKNPLLFHIGNPQAQPTNQIKTTSYNILTFLPLATLMQFKRLANVYFLVTAILQFIPAISPLSPISAIAPLIFVLAVSLIRTAVEQINKYKYDREANSSKFLVYEQAQQEEQSEQQQQQKNQPVRQIGKQNKKNISLGKWQLRCSNQLHVGDLIKIQQNQRFPADIILLSTSNKDGKVYIETSSLDGEKNLKIKTVLTTTQQLYASLQTISKIKENKPLVTIEQPSQQLYNFNAMLQCKHQSFLAYKTSSNIKNKHKQNDFIKINQFLYREAVLRNTQHIVGVIAYVGKYTKSMMNSSGGLDKMSKLERKVNFYMVFIFIFQFVLIFLCGVLRVTFFYNSQVGRSYNSIILQIQNPRGYIIECILTQCTYFILLNTMIPISLLVSIQVVKFGQGVFIGYDKLMSKKELSGVVTNSKAFRSSINQQLGMVEYIFTDKTGTLTKNQMVLQETIIGNISYQNQQRQQNSKLYCNSKLIQMCYNTNGEQFSNKFIRQLKLYIQKLQERDKNNRDRKQVNVLNQNNRKFMNTLMMVIMSTCHQCILANQGQSELIEYQGSSPDEITLVDSAARLGFKFIQNSYNKITLQISRSGINPTSVQFKVQQIFQFNSDRKRMSIILSHQLLPEYKILFCKGADSVIDRLLIKQYKDMEKESLQCRFYNKIKGQISEYSKIGLRTLLFGYKFIKNSEYQSLRQKLIQYSQFSKDTAFNSINSKQSIINILEQNLHLCGATAVQDKLQNQVQNVIQDLIKANIKVCMLTGDKLETAENIAKSCRLFKQDWKIIRIAEGSGQIDIFRGYCLVKDYVEASQQYGVIIEGSAIDKAINSIYFTDILANCAAAVCCRITPKNKAEVVNFAKNSLNKLVLSIGDGANDVPMIQAAHIGIGLYGNQGMNAVQASDFAIPEFRCLWRLLFVHGRWNYLRIAELIKYFFYKNIVFTLGQLWYAYFCSFSGTSIYNATYLVLFNTIFTGGPVVMRALLEQDLNYIQIIKEVKRLNLKQQKKVPKQLNQQLLHKQQVNTKNNINQRQSNKQNNVQDSSSQSQQETEEKNIKVSRLVIDKNMKCLFPLLYSHTQQQKSLTPRLFVLLIIESICESFGIFFIIYYGIQSQQLWIFSVCLYTTVLALVTIRICYDITYWTWLIVFIILFTSVLPYIVFVYIMSIWETELSGTFEQMLKMPDFYLCLGLALGIGSFLQASFNVITKYYFPQSIDFVRKEWKMMKQEQQKISIEESKIQRRKTIETKYKQILKSSRHEQDSKSGSSQKNSQMKKQVQIQLKQIKKTTSQISVTFSNSSKN